MDDRHRITIPTPFDVGRVNCYVFPGDHLTLLDPGPATEDAYAELTAGLQDLGFDVADVDRVLITHPHMDHFGIADRVVRASGARTVAHRDATGALADPAGHLEREQSFFEPFLVEMGVPADHASTVVTLPEAFSEYRDPVSIDREVTEGDAIDVGSGDALTAVHTPGHAPGSICLVDDADGVAFTGDHVLEHISPNPLLTVRPDDPDRRTRSLPTYLDSLHRIRAIGAGVGHAGHGDRIGDLPARTDEILDHHHRRKERIADMLEVGGPTSAYDVMGELFPDLPATETFPGISEVVGHLDLLEDENRIAIETRDGTRLYAQDDD